MKSSAVDTDFTAKLVDVHPDGYAQNITEGILRMRYLDSREKPGKIKSCAQQSGPPRVGTGFPGSYA